MSSVRFMEQDRIDIARECDENEDTRAVHGKIFYSYLLILKSVNIHTQKISTFIQGVRGIMVIAEGNGRGYPN